MFKAVVAVLLLPFVLVAGVIGLVIALIAISFTVVVPLIIPIAVAALCIWIGLRLASPATV